MRLRRRKPESDAPADPAVARSRETGGKQNPGYHDQHTTTGTTPSGPFVGRVTGEDAGAVEESGAERRAAARRSRQDEDSGTGTGRP